MERLIIKEKNANSVSGTGIGRRKNNEDIVLAIESDNDPDSRRVLIAVADGMGGLEAGEVASDWVSKKLKQLYANGLSTDLNSTLKNIKDCIKISNFNIHELSQKKGGIQMGTTVSGAVVIGNKYLVFNVGDSRTYLINKKDGAKQISIDHSVDQEACDAGLITKEQMGKGAYSNALTRTVGTDPEVDVDIFPKSGFGELKEGDVLFSCTDGLWGKVADDHIRREIMGRSDINRSLHVLYELAYKNGSKDNISMVAYRHGKFTGVTSKHKRPKLSTTSSGEPRSISAEEKKNKETAIHSMKIIVFVSTILSVIWAYYFIIPNLLNDNSTILNQNEKKIKENQIKNINNFDPNIKTNTDTVKPPTNQSLKKQNSPDENSNQPEKQEQSKTAPNSSKANTAGSSTPAPPKIENKQPINPLPNSETPTYEIPTVQLIQLDQDVRENIENNLKKITVTKGNITCATKSGNCRVVIAINSSGLVQSVDIIGINIDSQDKINEFKSRVGQQIKQIQFFSPTINGKPVNVNIGIDFKVSTLGKSIILER
ncbi:MAG: PP2C family protein-serine/threonine phosphatase [Candidatus Omnitrophota bacterium]